MTMMNNKPRIHKCPDGKAIGSDDLHYWAMRRNAGRAGVGMSREEWKKWGKPKKLDAADQWLARHDHGRR
jgi:hypothetical protein